MLFGHGPDDTRHPARPPVGAIDTEVAATWSHSGRGRGHPDMTRNKLMTAVYWFVAAEFLFGAVTKYWPGMAPFFRQDYAVKFVDWGYPSWFRFVVGALELIAAVLLVIPDRRPRFLGATTLVFVLTGAVTTHIVNHDSLRDSVSAPLHLIIAATLALANWPADWRDLLPRLVRASRSPATPPVRG
jgi:uncharacterized membrane protein YphA (DoxX/SURF4 family)